MANVTGMSGNFWKDRSENYADGYTVGFNDSDSTAVQGEQVKRPLVLYSVSVAANSNVGSGSIVLKNSSSTAGTADDDVHTVRIASGDSFTYHADFPRGMVYENGLVVSALTVTADVNLSYKLRYGKD